MHADPVAQQLFEEADLVYVHTVHLAAYVMPWLLSGKVVVDIHGIAPEEEQMRGRSEAAEFYQVVERAVITNCQHAVVVTNAMADYLSKKYCSNISFIVLPILPRTFDEPLTAAQIRDKHSAFKDSPTLLYAGGNQVWQNAPEMIDAVANLTPTPKFVIASHQQEEFQRLVISAGIASAVTITEFQHGQLGDFYSRGNLGFVLRDNHSVNLVSCPTKLVEYIAFGVVPVLKATSIGDFLDFNLQYVTIGELKEGIIPDATSATQMCVSNLNVLLKLKTQHFAGVERLQSLRPVCYGGSFRTYDMLINPVPPDFP